jgi:hypothetical protein
MLLFLFTKYRIIYLARYSNFNPQIHFEANQSMPQAVTCLTRVSCGGILAPNVSPVHP